MSANVLVVEDDESLRAALCDTLELAGYGVFPSRDGQDGLDLLGQEDVDIVVSDVQMDRMDGTELLKRIKATRPGLPVLMMTAHGTIQEAVDAMHHGAADYLVKPFDAEVLVSKVSRFMPADAGDGDMIASDPRSREMLGMAARVAKSGSTVLITGESGVGKEVLARAIHARSPRSDGPFVAVNCAAIPDNMLEAMLFGYEKGAFTGAHKSCPGKFEQAQSGTLLLDEISEMNLGLQAKLLRVLQEKEVERLGGTRLITLDVRVLATSNRDMRRLVREGRFREDLFYRLNVFPIEFPPLRDRPLDILPLAGFLLRRAAGASGAPVPDLSDDARDRLMAHSWPGNVRELDNVLQRALILHEGSAIVAADLCIDPPATDELAGIATGSDGGVLENDLKNRERSVIIEALREGRGSRQYAADKLGISPRTLRYKLAQMRAEGIRIPGRFD